jgi:hypothetical protein
MASSRNKQCANGKRVHQRRSDLMDWVSACFERTTRDSEEPGWFLFGGESSMSRRRVVPDRGTPDDHWHCRRSAHPDFMVLILAAFLHRRIQDG